MKTASEWVRERALTHYPEEPKSSDGESAEAWVRRIQADALEAAVELVEGSAYADCLVETCAKIRALKHGVPAVVVRETWTIPITFDPEAV